MVRYAIRRALAALLLAWLVASAAFALTWAAPGDAAQSALGVGASQGALAAERARLGLDRPFHEQYLGWMSRAAAGDLGTSFLYRAPVAPMVLDRAMNTALLGLAALALSLLLGLPPALVCALRPRSLASRVVSALSLVALSIPPFIGTLGLLLIASRLGVLPGGVTSASPAQSAGWLTQTADVLAHLPLPALALAIPLAATFERQQARALAEALAMPAVGAARARGLRPWHVLFRHAWRLSLGPVVALGGLACAALLGGSFVVEMITAWPGLGRLIYDALRARDLYLVAGCAMAGGIVLSGALFVTDLLGAYVDPRLARER